MQRLFPKVAGAKDEFYHYCPSKEEAVKLLSEMKFNRVYGQNLHEIYSQRLDMRGFNFKDNDGHM